MQINDTTNHAETPTWSMRMASIAPKNARDAPVRRLQRSLRMPFLTEEIAASRPFAIFFTFSQSRGGRSQQRASPLDFDAVSHNLTQRAVPDWPPDGCGSHEAWRNRKLGEKRSSRLRGEQGITSPRRHKQQTPLLQQRGLFRVGPQILNRTRRP